MNSLLWVVIAVIVFLVVVALFLSFSSAGRKKAVQNRRCPVCGMKLSMDERVFADQTERQTGPHQLTIKGCTHCYDN